VMISASHNPHHDNGIKFFGPDGYKLSDEAEAEIEAIMEEGVTLAKPSNIGRAKRIEDGRGRYVEYAKTTLRGAERLDGLKVVIDCANGAAYKAAPDMLFELGAEVIPVGVSPNGYNINEDCGSTKPDIARRRVLETGADVGLCLDGDADRVMVINERGEVADGDQIMGLFAGRWQDAGRLNNDTLVTTVMSNMGLEQHLKNRDILMLRTAVGDRYVVEAMRAGGHNLGGEQSGHIVMTDFGTTGDGMIAGLQFLSAMVETGDAASKLANVFDPYPQVLENIRYEPGQDPLNEATVKSAIAQGEASLAATGRLLIRKSGTEPLVRVMGECEDPVLLQQVIDDISGAIRKVLVS
jgi:phosphoglucosamine mutase